MAIETPTRAHTAASIRPEDVLSFWLDEVSPKEWYNPSDGLDQKILDKFGAAWRQAQAGGMSLWLTYASGALAYIILNDQFPRNMFRGSGQAFASDRIALAAAKAAIEKGWDMRIDPPARQFFYLPLMHSEAQMDQARCVRLMFERLPDDSDNLRHAKAHREIIRRFGRFPTRNAALGRATTAAERGFMEDEGGYGAILTSLDKTHAA